MSKLLWTATYLVVISAVHSYILLTANIDDLRNIGRRVAQSPIGGQVGSLVRRAYDVFNNHLGRARAQMRADDDDIVLSYHPEEPPEDGRRRNYEGESASHENKEFSALGSSASVYLDKIKKIFEKA